jgi:hypothetical protein
MNLFLLHPLREPFERTVITALDFFGESAGREFFHPQVVGDAFTALAFPRTRFISTIAFGFVAL